MTGRTRNAAQPESERGSVWLRTAYPFPKPFGAGPGETRLSFVFVFGPACGWLAVDRREDGGSLGRNFSRRNANSMCLRCARAGSNDRTQRWQ